MDSEKQPSVETEPVVIEGPGIESALLITIYLKSALEQIGEQLKSVRSDIKEVIADRDRWKTCAENADKRCKEFEVAVKAYLDQGGCLHPKCEDADGIEIMSCTEQDLCEVYYRS